MAEIRSDLRTYRRQRRHGDQAVEHETKDTFCADLDRKLASLMRAIGVPEALTFAPGSRSIGGRRVVVIEKARPGRRAAPDLKRQSFR
ncbi:hypothetical protein MMMDOFMJ_0160 [Methylobacterium gnaphalii]|nr:hypothetical protein MMMDOFMJ_0160 [Methylobacterium gnaphalii]